MWSYSVPPHEIGVFVRSADEVERALSMVQAANLLASVLDGQSDGDAAAVAVSTMHLAKGLEFRSVAVVVCDDEVVPSQAPH